MSIISHPYCGCHLASHLGEVGSHILTQELLSIFDISKHPNAHTICPLKPLVLTRRITVVRADK